MAGVIRGRKIRKTALALVSIYGDRCAKCGQRIDLTLRHPAPGSLSIGHQLPRARGGSDAIENLRPEHLHCNTAAGARITRAPRQPAVTPGFFGPAE